MPLDSPFDSLRGIRSPFGGRRVASGVSDADAQAYIDAVETADGQTLEAGVKTAYETFIFGCKTDGNWTAIQSAAILAGARTLPGALVALKGTAPTNVSSNFVSADYARKTGLKGDGSTKALSTGFSTINQNDNHMLAYVTDDGTPDTFMGVMGQEYSASAPTHVYFTTDDKVGARNAGQDTFKPPRSGVPGLYGTVRNTASSFGVVSGGVTNSFTDTSSATDTSEVAIFRRGNDTTFFDGRVAFYSMGDFIDVAALDARLSQLVTDLDGAIA